LTPYPAGGLAPGDSSYVGPTLKELEEIRQRNKKQLKAQRAMLNKNLK